MAILNAPTRHRLSVADFQRMIYAGILHEDERIELIVGDLINMAPIGSEHASVIDWLTRMLILATGQSAIVRVQSPLLLDDYSQPQPDVLVLQAREDFYRHAHPRPDDVLLLIEVADTSVRFDRDVKIPLYAKCGVPEVWLLDLGKKCVEVYRGPQPEIGRYREMAVHTQGYLVPERLPTLTVEVERLF
jgi:Uma2 family endonuclease